MRRSIATVLGLLLLVGCGGGPDPVSPPLPPPPPVRVASVSIFAGNTQAAAPSTTVEVAPTVLVRNGAGQPMGGVLVTFAVEAGGGSIAGDTVRTGGDGLAKVGWWRLGPLPAENRMRASADTVTPVSFTATGQYLVTTTTIAGQVVLPAGSQLNLAQLRVQSGLTDVPVDGGGAFTAAAQPGGIQFGAVHAPNGQPVFFGWLGATHRAFNARTTAEVMAFFDLGGYLLPEFKDRKAVREYLADYNFTALIAAIQAALAIAPEQVTLATDGVKQARLAAVQAIKASNVVNGPARGIIIEPSGTEQSGVNVDQVGLNNIIVTNHRRRRVVAFVDRVSYVPKGLRPVVPWPVPGQPININAVGSATSVIGTGIDILFGNMAWAPVVTEPIPTPLFPADAVATKYRVTVVGPGVRNPAAPLTTLQRDEQRRASFETLILEGLLPLLDVALSLDNELSQLGGGPELQSVVRTFVDFMPAGVLESAAAGDMQGALIGAWKVLQDSGPAQELLLKTFLGMVAKQGVPPDAILDRAKEWVRALTIVEILATAGDLIFVVKHSATANDAETWDVNVGEAKVVVNPERAFISNLDFQTFEAKVLDATDGGPAPVFRYRWSTSGNFGDLCAAIVGCGTAFTTSRDVVSYAPDVLKEGTDQIRVQVYIVEDGKEVVIGEATAEVTTYAAKVTLAPENSSIGANEMATLTATVDTRLQDGGTLSYLWSTAGALGTFLLGQTVAETSLNQITYVANKDKEGTEVVAVQAFSTKDGVRRNLGQAQANIKVERRRPTTVMGSWQLADAVPLEAGRTCVIAYITFSLVAGAKSYDVHAYGFNDTAFWGRDIRFGVTPPTQTYLPCSLTTGWGRSGTTGGEYRFFLSGIAGPASSVAAGVASMSARFAGMVVEVTVKY